LTVSNSPNFEQFNRLLQKSQVSKSPQRLFFQNLTKARFYGTFVTILLTNIPISNRLTPVKKNSAVSNSPYFEMLLQPTAIVVPHRPLMTSRIRPHVKNPTAFWSEKPVGKTELKLPETERLFRNFELRFDVTLNRRKPRIRNNVQINDLGSYGLLGAAPGNVGPGHSCGLRKSENR
jgi:hypothetical protein